MSLKILFITTSFGNYSDSQTIRYFQYLKGIKDDDKINVDFIVPNCLDVNLDLFSNLDFPFRVFKTEQILSQKVEKSCSGSSFLSKVFKNIAYYFFYPDYFSGFSSVVLKKFKDTYPFEKPDVIISSSGSCEAHIAAYKLKKKYNLKWITDFGDPWSIIDKDQRPWFYKITLFYEKKIFSNSDTVLFTTDETLNEYRKIYPNVKMEVLEYGYVSDQFFYEKSASKKIKIAHIGAAYASDRNLIPCIEAISQYRDNFDFSIIGNHSAKFQEFAASINYDMNFVNRVSFEDSLVEINKTDVLVIIGNIGKLQIPGKVFHYLASGKVILYTNQQSLDTDPSYKILKKFGGVLFCENTYEGIKERIEYILENYEELSEVSTNRSTDQNLLQYESSNLSSKLICYIKNIQ
jgi:hypothetical protein